MSHEPRYTDHVEAYPRAPHEGRPEPSRRTAAIQVALIATGILVGCGLVVGGGFALLYAFNPMGDEWICSDGEAPGGVHGRYNQCYPEDEPLPTGVVWDPFGNRPMPYNCDKDGWVPIERTVSRRGVTDVEQDCVREGTELPGRWRVRESGSE